MSAPEPTSQNRLELEHREHALEPYTLRDALKQTFASSAPWFRALVLLIYLAPLTRFLIEPSSAAELGLSLWPLLVLVFGPVPMTALLALRVGSRYASVNRARRRAMASRLDELPVDTQLKEYRPARHIATRLSMTFQGFSGYASLWSVVSLTSAVFFVAAMSLSLPRGLSWADAIIIIALVSALLIVMGCLVLFTFMFFGVVMMPQAQISARLRVRELRRDHNEISGALSLEEPKMQSGALSEAALNAHPHEREMR